MSCGKPDDRRGRDRPARRARDGVPGRRGTPARAVASRGADGRPAPSPRVRADCRRLRRELVREVVPLVTGDGRSVPDALPRFVDPRASRRDRRRVLFSPRLVLQWVPVPSSLPAGDRAPPTAAGQRRRPGDHVPRPFLSGLRGRLLLLVALATLPAFALSWYTGWENRQRQRAGVSNDTVRAGAHRGERPGARHRRDAAGPGRAGGDPRGPGGGAAAHAGLLRSCSCGSTRATPASSLLDAAGNILVSEPAGSRRTPQLLGPAVVPARAGPRDFTLGRYQVGQLTGRHRRRRACPSSTGRSRRRGPVRGARRQLAEPDGGSTRNCRPGRCWCSGSRGTNRRRAISRDAAVGASARGRGGARAPNGRAAGRRDGRVAGERRRRAHVWVHAGSRPGRQRACAWSSAFRETRRTVPRSRELQRRHLLALGLVMVAHARGGLVRRRAIRASPRVVASGRDAEAGRRRPGRAHAAALRAQAS